MNYAHIYWSPLYSILCHHNPLRPSTQG